MQISVCCSATFCFFCNAILGLLQRNVLFFLLCNFSEGCLGENLGQRGGAEKNTPQMARQGASLLKVKRDVAPAMALETVAGAQGGHWARIVASLEGTPEGTRGRLCPPRARTQQN